MTITKMTTIMMTIMIMTTKSDDAQICLQMESGKNVLLYSLSNNLFIRISVMTILMVIMTTIEFMIILMKSYRPKHAQDFINLHRFACFSW